MKRRIIAITLAIILIIAIIPMAAIAQPRTVNPTPSTVYVDGERVEFRAYLIDGNNFFMLRALAYALNGTQAQFNVGWDGRTNTITLTSGQPYEVEGGETALGPGTAQTATPTTSRVVLDGVELNLTAYNIGGNNFFRLRDVMRAIDVGVIWDGHANAIMLETSIGYYEAEDFLGSAYTGSTHIEGNMIFMTDMGITDARLAEMIATGEIPATVEVLVLSLNYISDLSPLSSLTNLHYLRLQRNRISDLTPLSSLRNLTSLDLSRNQIQDNHLDALRGLTNLEQLVLSENMISDISSLSSLTNLQRLFLGHNTIEDISPLAMLTELTTLNLQFNRRISNLSPLGGLTNLTSLNFQVNSVSDLQPLSHLVNMRYLSIGSNPISSLRPLFGLRNVHNIDISGMTISQQALDEINAAMPNTTVFGSMTVTP